MRKRSRVPPVIDYNEYVLCWQEIVRHLLIGVIFMGIVSYLFYDSVIAWILLMPFAAASLKRKKAQLCKKRRQKLEIEFREVILSVSSSLQAGYSVENAFKEAYQDIVLLYGRDSAMAKELSLMLRKLENNEQIEHILLNLAKRSGVDDIRDFADIFQIAKRNGGDIRAIIANTAAIIGDKQEVRREIETVMSEKKMEQKIMRYIPFFIIFYISLTSKGYFDSLYHNILGWMIMTGALAVYASACQISEKILDIEV